MAQKKCPCYRQKPQRTRIFGLADIWKYATLGSQHYQLTNGDVCHDECMDKGFGYCTDELYWDSDTDKIMHTECELEIPKRAWIHCDCRERKPLALDQY